MMAMLSLEQRRAHNRERNTRWRAKHVERKREQANRWYAANKAQAKASTARWQQANPEKVNAKAARWRALHPGASSRWSQVNPEKAAAKSQRWRDAHPERAKEIARKSCEKNRDNIRARQNKRRADNIDAARAADRVSKRRRYERCPEVILANRKRWRDANLERLKPIEAASRLRNAVGQKALYKKWASANQDKRRAHEMARRARKHAAFVEKVNPVVVFDRDRGMCGICREPVDRNEKWHIDHVVPLSKGGQHSYANVQLSHATCNCKKHDKFVAA